MKANRIKQRKTGLRLAFTITEVLVTIALIAILMGLIIPAVMQSRAAAQRLSCSNQLRQLTLASAQYESTYGAFPSGQFFTQIRSYVEVPEKQRTIVLYACPSDRTHATGDISEGKISYAVNDGLGSTKPEHQGILSGKGATTKASEIFDGLSNTALIAERLSQPWYAPQVVAWDELKHDWKRTLLYFREPASSPDEFEHHCGNLSVRPMGTWVTTYEYHHLRTPNTQGCVFLHPAGLLPLGTDFSIGVSAGSPHSGGTFVGYCDGSVNFVSDQIALTVWRAQGTRSGGEVF